MPVLTPAELWERPAATRSPRSSSSNDRAGPRLRPPDDARGDGHVPRPRDPVVQAAAAALVPLPVKDRDEPRPRGGLIRVREFIMKDAYSFDRDEDGLDAELRATAAPTTGSSSAAASRRYDVAGRVRDHGRQAAASTSSRRPARARTRSSSARTATTRPTSRSRAGIPSRARRSRRRSTRPRRSRRRRDDDRGARGVPRRSTPRATSKAMPVVTDDGTRRARARPRRRPAERDRSSSPRSGAPRGPRPTRRSARRSAPSGGSLGPVGFDGEVIADEALREGQFVAGANRDGSTCAASRPAATSSRGSPTSASPVEGDRCPECGGASDVPDRDRGRPHLQASRRATRSRSTRRSSTRTAREAVAHGLLRDRPGPRHRRRGRAEPRRERDLLAAVDRAVRRPCRRAARSGGAGRRGRARARRGRGATCSSTTATRGRGRSSRTPT